MGDLWAEGCSLWVLQVVAVALEDLRSDLGRGLADQVALGDEDLVVVPAASFTLGSVGPANNGSSGRALRDREPLELQHLGDDRIAHGAIVAGCWEHRPSWGLA
jgi:hypothetical protein